MAPKADFLIESSWEVCNKVGGIYTVVKSKVGPTQAQYGENYILIGPYFPKKAYGIFEERVPPEECKECFEKLKEEGIEIHWGTWLIPGNPVTALIDFTKFSAQKNDIKRKLWDWYQIDSLNTEWFDFDEPVVWAYAVGRVIEALSHSKPDKKIVAQFHEWLCGAGLLYLHHQKVPVGTVFTTHATTLGRSIAMSGRDLYGELEKLDSDLEAKKLGPSVWAKHLMEKQTANTANVFTTVSEITGMEAEHILNRKPDVLLFNGLDISKFPTFEQASVKHTLFKSRMNQFLLYYFFPYYHFDLDSTLIYFVAGRYEFHDKGIDVFISSLQKLNEQLKKEKCEKTIVAFFFVPGNVKGIRSDLLENRTLFMDIFDSMVDLQQDIQNKIIQLLVTGTPITNDSLFSPDVVQELIPKIKRFKRAGNPPTSTHELYNDADDEIMNSLRKAGLDNSEDDRVKVVFYPIYLSGADGLLDTSYYESMQGSHLGVFPSYYEPWGYTPLEAAALGVSSITTDLAGFGRYLCTECKPQKFPGIFVLPRYKKSYDNIISELTNLMTEFVHYSPKERTSNKIAAQRLAATADWNNFIKFYIEAQDMAVDRLQK